VTPPPHDPLADLAEAIGNAVRMAERTDSTDLDVENAARLRRLLDGAARRFSDARNEVDYDLSNRLDRNDRLVVDGAVYEVTVSTTRKGWDNDAVRREVVKGVLFDPTTGEQRTAEDVVRCLAKLYPLGGSGLRLTEAKSLLPGFDPDEFCQTEHRRAIRMTEAKAAHS
jgi:hypothetical protein